MERLIENLPVLLGALLGMLLAVSLIAAILRTDQSTRATLNEVRKTNAILLAAFDLEDAPPVKGRPRIVKARKGPAPHGEPAHPSAGG